MPAKQPKVIVVKTALREDGESSTEQIVCASGEAVREAIDHALDGRIHGVMLRVNEDALAKLDALVEGGICESRSGAATFMIHEGIRANESLFARVEETTTQIAALKAQLHELVGESKGKKESSQTSL
ncbi:hypothetical protein KKG90_05285 [Candidatus Bipolaricaulota bacterium]|nr:hypothetical protein [Candidatus Bipolaricaulota bacterium]